jgi:hypothetical protein
MPGVPGPGHHQCARAGRKQLLQHLQHVAIVVAHVQRATQARVAEEARASRKAQRVVVQHGVRQAPPKLNQLGERPFRACAA